MIVARKCSTADVGFSEPESEWLEAEVNSATLDQECLARKCDWIKDKRNRDK